MFLFTIYVDNEYTAKILSKTAKKLGISCIWQWVKSGPELVIACDFHDVPGLK
jgi:hypothetical protein